MAGASEGACKHQARCELGSAVSLVVVQTWWEGSVAQRQGRRSTVSKSPKPPEVLPKPSARD